MTDTSNGITNPMLRIWLRHGGVIEPDSGPLAAIAGVNSVALARLTELAQ